MGCRITNNEASVWGGGVSFEHPDGGYPHLINTDFRDNRAAEAPQGWLGGSGAFMLLECSSFDLDLWTLHGYWQIDDENCTVAAEQSTWGEVKARYR